MCGIAGIFGLHGTLSEERCEDVPRMLAVQSHRGPDAEGVWRTGSLALGHRRLAIFDTGKNADQPMVTQDGRGVIAFNGAVYNFREIRQELEQEGLNFRTQSDTEVVLAALHAWGPDRAARAFNGMFALAYYDSRSHSLWFVRDRLGIKPLSVAILADRIVFASEDKAILACRGISPTLNVREVILRLAFQSREGTASMFHGLERLPPAAIWRICDGRVERREYWDALEAVDPGRLAASSSSAANNAALERHLGRSVELHCRADAALATACSAGVDSGLITALVRNWRTEFHAYVVDPDSRASEAADAERTARHLGVELRPVPLGQELFLELWPRVVHHLETGGWLTSDIALLALAERCRNDGVKVLLTGEGADELFGGYAWHLEDAARWRRLAWPRNLLLSKSRKRSLERLMDIAPFGRARGTASGDERGIAAISLAPEQNFLAQRIMRKLAPVASPVDRVFVGSGIHDLYTHLRELLHRHDRLSMAHGIELRVPYLENALIDFALHLHPRERFRGKQGKWILKRMAARYLPAANVWAKKRGFPIEHGFTGGTQSLLRGGMLADTLGWSNAEVADIVGLASKASLIRIRLVGMEMFLRTFFGRESPEMLTEALTRAKSRHRAGNG